MNVSGLLGKLFYTSAYFTIALKKRSDEHAQNGFHAESVFPATRQEWSADPMLVDDDEKTYLFYEAVSGDHGRIEAVEVYDDCTVSVPTIILQGECHYSYPFVFRKDDQWYMIPESSAAEEVRLYRAVEFPYHWEQQEILLHARTVDTTVFEQDGHWYLLTFLTDGKSERVTPNAFEMRFEEEHVRLEKMKWDAYDSLHVRGAGQVFRDGERLLRPAQVSTETRYGDALAFYEVHAGEESYSEKYVCTMAPGAVFAKGCRYDGLHTYCASERFEAIDLRCRDFDLFKLPRRIFGAMKR